MDYLGLKNPMGRLRISGHNNFTPNLEDMFDGAMFDITTSDLSDSNQRPKDAYSYTTVLRSTNWAKVGMLRVKLNFL